MEIVIIMLVLVVLYCVARLAYSYGYDNGLKAGKYIASLTDGQREALKALFDTCKNTPWYSRLYAMFVVRSEMRRMKK